MMQSINAFFHSSKDTTRHPSDASGSTIAEESDEIQIKADDIEKNLSTSVALSTKKSTDTGSHSSTSTSQEGETVADDNNVDPFAGGVEGGVTYQSLTWWYAAFGLVAETISLGILGLAKAFATLGLIPGIFVIVIVSLMATYAGYVIWQFKMKHRHIHSMGDAGMLLFGPVGREVCGIGALLFMIFIMGSHMIAGSRALSVFADNKFCAAGWAAIFAVVCFVCTSFRTLKMTTYMSVLSCISVIGATIAVIVDLSNHKPGFEVINGEMPNKYTLWTAPDATPDKIFGAVTTIMFAFAGHVAFPTFISELKDPKEFPKALAALQITDSTMYAVSAIVMYYYGGQQIKSPALASASAAMKKPIWGVVFATVVVAGVIVGHISIKYVYVRCLRNRDEDLMHQKTFKAYGIWLGIGFGLWLVAFILSQLIPRFADMLSLTGALFATLFTFGLPGMFWMHMNLNLKKGGRLGWRIERAVDWNWKKTALLCLNILLVVAGIFSMITGLYSTGVSLGKSVTDPSWRPFSCTAPSL